MTKKGVESLFVACPVCFQVEQSATTDGIQAAVLVLLGVTAVVLAGLARFVVGFVRREASLEARRQAESSSAPEVPR